MRVRLRIAACFWGGGQQAVVLCCHNHKAFCCGGVVVGLANRQPAVCCTIQQHWGLHTFRCGVGDVLCVIAADNLIAQLAWFVLVSGLS